MSDPREGENGWGRIWEEDGKLWVHVWAEYIGRTEEKQNMVVKAPYRVWETVEAA